MSDGSLLHCRSFGTATISMATGAFTTFAPSLPDATFCKAPPWKSSFPPDVSQIWLVSISSIVVLFPHICSSKSGISGISVEKWWQQDNHLQFISNVCPLLLKLLRLVRVHINA